uniref:Bm8697 n=1 Tax=Brugia malayi TaxID=6279 RepID=A0A1I9G8A5_BRUMA|nr:Bm8697 [Brugia malayi]
MHREKLNFESRSIRFSSAQQKESFKRNSVKALKNTNRRPGGLEMILASIDDSFILLSDLITTTEINDANLRIDEKHDNIVASDFTDNSKDCMIWKNDGKIDNCDNFIDKTLSQKVSQEIAKIDLTEEEIIQWMGGLPIINPNKILAYFCDGTKKILSNYEPYQIFSFTKNWQINDQIMIKNLITEVCSFLHIS